MRREVQCAARAEDAVQEMGGADGSRTFCARLPSRERPAESSMFFSYGMSFSGMPLISAWP